MPDIASLANRWANTTGILCNDDYSISTSRISKTVKVGNNIMLTKTTTAKASIRVMMLGLVMDLSS